MKEADCAQVAKEKKISQEEAGRFLRYQAYEEALKLYGKKTEGKRKIAVAHHAKDQAETMLFHLFRGTGINGLAGILPVRDSIIRPLLILQREEIEDYLTKKGIAWCEDATNQEEYYTRNKIRHSILGYAKKEINEKAIQNISRTAMQMVSLREYLEKEVDKAQKSCGKIKGTGIEIYLPDFLTYPSFLREQMLVSWVGDFLPQKKDFTSVHIEEIRKLIEKEGCKEICLPQNTRIRKEYDYLILEKKKERSAVREEIFLEEGTFILDEERVLEIKILKKEDFFSIEENQYTKYLDYGKIYNRLSLRSRQTGDYIVINDKGQKKKLKEYMIEEKIPKDQRQLVPVIAEGSHILWIVGYRISAYYKISEETEKILQIKIKRRE